MIKQFAIVLGCSLSFVAAASVQADALANWTFETSIPATAGPHTAEGGLNAASSFATGSHVNPATVYSNPSGNGSVESFSSNAWAMGDYYRFTTNSLGFQDITITWDQTGSATGPRDFVLEYGTDGVSYTTFQSYSVIVASPAWSAGTPILTTSFSADLTSITAVNNSATLYFRMTVASGTAINGSPIAAGGTGRVDNILISGNAIPAPGALALLGLAGLVSRRRRRA